MCGPTLSTNINATRMVKETARTHRLHFSTTVSEFRVLSNGDYTQKEKAECWWSPSDHTDFRNGAKENTRDARKFQRHLITKMEESYNVAQLLGRSHDEKDFNDLLQDPRRLYPQLDKWAARTDCRGLERCMFQARRSEGLEIREMVLDMDHMGVTDIEIAEAYTDQVRTHTLYARMIGDADYRAAYSL